MSKDIKVIIISGKQGSGKTTLTKNLLKRIPNSVQLKFAEPLYKMHDALRIVCQTYGIPFEQKEGKLLQLLGTEWLRNKNENVFIDSLKHVMSKLPEGSVVIIDDCRFKNELLSFSNAFKIRLEASRELRKQRAEGWRNDENHISETDLDNCLNLFDFCLQVDNYTQIEVCDQILNEYLKWKH